MRCSLAPYRRSCRWAPSSRTHHERWDGDGYPRGLAGEEIPRDGRIAAVADVFDALTSDRVHRPAFPVRLAIDKMQAERASHFDPEVLDAFMAALPEVEAIRRAYGELTGRTAERAGLRRFSGPIAERRCSRGKMSVSKSLH
jgi:hypothetical protein